MRNLRIGLMATGALMGCVGLVDTGNAQAIYGGGATFPAPVYRYLFDCWHTPVDGNPPAGGPTGFLAPFPIAPACPNPAGNASGVLAQILYAPVGSGGGKRAIKNHDCSSAATGLGTPAAANAVPYVSSQLPAYGYPSCHFAGSDDTWNAADAADWVTKGNPAKYGLLLQLPAFSGPVTIPFNGKDGTGTLLNIVNPTPAGGSSGLNLSRKALCGIFSGHITQWSNPTLTALNGGVPLGAGPITVVHRSDGSGTTFLFAQAMFAQCVGEFGPNSESDPTIASWAFPWSDRSVGAGPCPALIYRAANALNWEDLGTNQCGASIPAVPGTFAAGSGNAGVVSAVRSGATYVVVRSGRPARCRSACFLPRPSGSAGSWKRQSSGRFEIVATK
jgi:ABC-type phosphate transport system substrate-binding protein